MSERIVASEVLRSSVARVNGHAHPTRSSLIRHPKSRCASRLSRWRRMETNGAAFNVQRTFQSVS